MFEAGERFGVRTGNGCFVVLDKAAIEKSYAPLPVELATEERPCHVDMLDISTVLPFVEAAAVAFTITPGRLRIREAERYGDVFLMFEAHRRAYTP
jgi:hypothetical protein